MKKENIETPEVKNEMVKTSNGNGALSTVSSLDELDEAEAAPIELAAEYWSPEPGEVKRVIFDRIATTKVLSAINAKELIDLEVCFMITKENGEAKQIMNGSKRLVGLFQSYNTQHGQAFEIRYLGKQKNKTNNFQSDSWSVSPLLKKQ